jgi:uncharacterized RDD family membrane protein YckC
MNMSIIKAKIGKRILAGVIDQILLFIITFALFYYPMKSLYSDVFDVPAMREENYELMEEYGLVYEDDSGEYQLTKDGSDASSEAYQNYLADQRYIDLKSKENTLVFIEMTSSLFISETVLFLIIPLLLRNGQTLGKKMVGIILVDDNYIKVKFLNVFLRYITILVLGSILSLLTYGIPLFLTFILMLVSKDNRTIHDYLSATRVIEKEQLHFASPQERIDYDGGKLPSTMSLNREEK